MAYNNSAFEVVDGYYFGYPPKESKTRIQIEGAFGLGKRRYDLDLVKARTMETSESWIGNVLFVMNIASLLR